MATFACVSLPPQFITPPPSTSTQHNNDSDCGSSTGTNEGGMKVHEATSDDGSTSSSSQPTPPEFPSPPPPSNSPPESMASLQAELPNDTGGRPCELTSHLEKPKVKAWMAQHGFHPVPLDGHLPPNPHSVLFVHVNDGETLQFQRKSDHEVVGNLVGPGTARMVGEFGMTANPLPIHLRQDQQCHQFVDEEGNLRHVVLSVASPENGSQNPRELNVPQLVGPQQLMQAMGIQQQQPRGPSRGGGTGRGRGGAYRGREQRGGGFAGHNRGHGNGNNHGNGVQNGGHQNGHQNGNGNHRGGHKYHNGSHHHNHHVRQEYGHPGMMNNIPEMVPVPIQNHVAPMNELYPNVEMMQQPPPAVVHGQMSLLGEPNVPPIAEMAIGMANNNNMGIPPPPGFAMLPPPQEPEMAMAVVNGQMQPGLLQDPMMPGTSQMYPPPGLVTMANNTTNYNNNQWFTNQMAEEENAAREVLCKGMNAPEVANCSPTEIEIYWRPIQIRQWQRSTPNGLFPAVSPSEIVYNAVVFDQFGKQVLTLTLVPNNEEKCLFAISKLHPNTPFDIHLKASIPERGIIGEPTIMVRAFTAPGRPDAPAEAQVCDRGADFLMLVWKESINNGVFVSLYNVFIVEDEQDNGRIISVNTPKVCIPGLQPQTRYRISISAINALGESLTTCHLDAFTSAVRLPDIPKNFDVFPLSHRSIRLSWEADPNCLFWVETVEGQKRVALYAREQFAGNNTILNDLQSDTDYKIRLICRNEFGEAHTAWISTRTQQFRRVEVFPTKTKNGEIKNVQQTNYDRPPTTPFFLRNVEDCPEMGWKAFGPDQRGNTYVVEAATYEAPEDFNQIYRGSATSLIVVDETMYYLRVYTIHRKGYRSNTTDKVIIPRDYNRLRPERVTDVTIAMQQAGSVIVEWKALEREKMKIPKSATIRYYVKQADKSDCMVLCVNESSLVYLNVPGETTLTLSVCAAVAYHDAVIHGDWSSPVSITTPRSLPAPVTDILYTCQSSILSWECADQSPDLKFAVEVNQVGVNARQVLRVLTKEKNVMVHGVELGQSYEAIVTSYTNVGSTPHQSTFNFMVPAEKPTTPSEGSMISASLNKATVVWGASEENGSAITGYSVRLMLNGDELRNSFVEVSDVTVYRANIKDLTPNTVYDVLVAARNDVGDSEPLSITVKTKALAPITPLLNCEPEHFVLKLSWEHVTSSPSISYKIIRINNNGQQVSVYEGDNNSVKVQRLSEDTEYSFKIRVLDKETGASTWSEPFTFRTLIAPPPAAKLPLTTSQVAGRDYTYNVEWPDYFKSKRKPNEYFRLQVADATNKEAKWEMVYEGTAPRYELHTEQYPGALHIRVMCVRREENGGELRGTPSEVGYIGNAPPVVNTTEVVRNGVKEKIIGFAQRNSTPISYFVALMICIAVFFKYSEVIFMYLTGQNPHDQHRR